MKIRLRKFVRSTNKRVPKKKRWKYVYCQNRWQDNAPNPGDPDVQEFIKQWGNGGYQFINSKGQVIDKFEITGMNYRAIMDSKGKPIYYNKNSRSGDGPPLYRTGFDHGYRKAQYEDEKKIKALEKEIFVLQKRQEKELEEMYNRTLSEGYELGVNDTNEQYQNYARKYHVRAKNTQSKRHPVQSKVRTLCPNCNTKLDYSPIDGDYFCKRCGYSDY